VQGKKTPLVLSWASGVFLQPEDIGAKSKGAFATEILTHFKDRNVGRRVLRKVPI
jgi:hypothetical protein